MRFTNENYLKAFPRTEKHEPVKVTVVDPNEGNVLDEVEKAAAAIQTPEPTPAPVQDDPNEEGGDPDGTE